jgi:hypothetical protein
LLLKALVALGASEVQAPALTDRMWPDADGDRAQQAFATALHRLRALLGDERALVLADGRLSLAPDRVWVDTLALPALLARATPRDDDRARELLTVYRGPFLAGEPDADWAEPLRARLARRFTAFALGRCAALEPAPAPAARRRYRSSEPSDGGRRARRRTAPTMAFRCWRGVDGPTGRSWRRWQRRWLARRAHELTATRRARARERNPTRTTPETTKATRIACPSRYLRAGWTGLEEADVNLKRASETPPWLVWR